MRLHASATLRRPPARRGVALRCAAPAARMAAGIVLLIAGLIGTISVTAMFIGVPMMFVGLAIIVLDLYGRREAGRTSERLGD